MTSRGPGDGANTRAVAIATTAIVVSMLPLSLGGAYGPNFISDLEISPGVLGYVLSLFGIAGALSARVAGGYVDKLGATRSLRLGLGITLVACLALSQFSGNLVTFGVLMAIAGVGNGIAMPASNRLLSIRVLPGRLGTALGLKQSAAPVATIIAGGVVAVLASAHGLLGGFTLAALLTCIPLAALAKRAQPTQRLDASGPFRPSTGPRALLMAFSLVAAIGSGVTAMLVTAGVGAGLSWPAAGVLLSISGAIAMLVRIVVGRVCDLLRWDHAVVCYWLLGAGALGAILCSLNTPTALISGAPLALAGVWGVNVVLWYMWISMRSHNPGAASGQMTLWGGFGVAAGPIILGLCADGLGFSAMWLASSVLAVAATLCIYLAKPRITPP